MDISSRTQPRGGEGETKHPTENGKTNNTLIPIFIWINAFSGSTAQAPDESDLALPITAANLWEKQQLWLSCFTGQQHRLLL